jgi:hypothetical protein
MKAVITNNDVRAAPSHVLVCHPRCRVGGRLSTACGSAFEAIMVNKALLQVYKAETIPVLLKRSDAFEVRR